MFSSIFGGGSSSSSSSSKPSSSIQSRQQQIDQFERMNPSAQPLSADKNAFDLMVTTRFGNLIFRVTLPVAFPNVAPQLAVLNRCTHPWIHTPTLQITGHPKLQQWSPHYSLGMVVLDVYNAFLQDPPQPVAGQAATGNANVAVLPPGGSSDVHLPPALHPPPHHGHQSAASTTAAQTQQVGASPSSSSGQSQSPQPPVPFSDPVPRDFPVLQSYSLVQLKELLNDADLLDEMVHHCDMVESIIGVKDGLYKQVKALAEQNLAHEAAVEQRKAELTTLKQRAQAENEVLAGLLAEQKQMLDRYSHENVIRALEEAMDKADSESGDLSQRIENIDEHIKRRQAYHRLNAMRERLQFQHLKRTASSGGRRQNTAI